MTWTVPGYVVEKLVGHGATGEVWRGRGTADGEVVALKRLLIEDAAALRGAEAEAAVLAVFAHPHILRLRELVVSEGEAILVTDFADRGSLAQVLEHRGRLSPGEVVTIVAPIAAALAHAHSEGVVHGDVSASNILFTADGLPLLGDLGVARIVGQVDGGTRATPHYVDPLVAQGHAPGPHSDVFALAAVAWHALTGSPPWAGESVAESLSLAADGGLPSIRTVVPTVPVGLADAVDRALQDDGVLRGSAAELALDSRHAVEPVPVDGWTARPGAAPTRGRHCAPDKALDSAARRAPDNATASDADHDPAPPHAGRPPFRRAEPAGLVSPSARTRATGPGPAARTAGSALVAPRGARRRWAAAVLCGAAVLSSVAVGGWWGQRDSQRSESNPPVPRRLASPSATVLDPAGSPTAQSTAPSTDPAALNWLAVLARADAARAQAYATGDGTLLDQVYSSATLLEQDRRQLTVQVPPGCGLDGAKTHYSGIEVQEADPRSVRLTATAVLDQAHLSCAGATQATTPQVGPVRLAVVLSFGADGVWRIEDQRIAG
jgi:hypothetical protein